MPHTSATMRPMGTVRTLLSGFSRLGNGGALANAELALTTRRHDEERVEAWCGRLAGIDPAGGDAPAA
jgi:hypothetical protein